MPRKSDRKRETRSPIHDRQRELDLHARQIKEKLDATRAFLKKAPEIKAEVTRKQQRAIFERFGGPARVAGPPDIRLELVQSKTAKPPRSLRKDRSKAPLVTVLLLGIFIAVVYYAWRALSQG